MRILHLAWEYPPVVYGGLGRHVAALTAAQAAMGHDVTVVTQRPAGTDAEEAIGGVRVLRADPGGGFPYGESDFLPWVERLESRLAGLAATTRCDVVHAHDWMVARAAASVSRGRRYLATVHATEAGRHQGWLPDATSEQIHVLEQWLCDEADAVIVCSHAMAAEVLAVHGVHAHVIPNGISTQWLEGIDGARDPRLLTFVGRIEWEKGVFTAVEAMPALLSLVPDARLQIVGTGTREDEVSDLIDRLGLGGSVVMRGHIDDANLRRAYLGSAAVLAPSSYEPFGLVALEAAATGAPLIAGRAGGLAEFVEDGVTGWLVEPQSPQALALVMAEVLGDPVEAGRRARAARGKVEAYTWSSVAGTTIDLYERACDGRRRPPRQTVIPPLPLL